MADWVAAVATGAAIVIALFRETFLVWWRRPILDIRADGKPPDSHQTLMQGAPGQLRPVYYLRVLVQNKGKSRANHVQVHLDGLYRQDNAGHFYEDTDFLPMYLGATHTPGGTVIDGISRGMGRHIDLAHLDQASTPKPVWFPPSLPANKAWLALKVEFEAFKATHILGPGRYRLAITVAAANAEPVPFLVELWFDGNWDNDESTMLSSHVSLSKVARR